MKYPENSYLTHLKHPAHKTEVEHLYTRQYYHYLYQSRTESLPGKKNFTIITGINSKPLIWSISELHNMFPM